MAALACCGALLAEDRASGTVIGSSRNCDWNPAEPSVAIGYTFPARSHRGGVASRGMQRLMLDHVFGWRFNSYTHMFTAAARFSDSIAPQPGTVNGRAPSAASDSRGSPRASLPKT